MELTKIKEDVIKCLEYSEQPEVLKAVLNDIKVYIGEPVYRKYFPDDKEARNTYTVTIKRGDLRVSFKFGDSIDATNRGERLSLYSILCSVGLDYYCPETFKEFCGEYGYSEDSMTAHKTFKRCKKQSQKLQAIFNDDEANAMPR